MMANCELEIDVRAAVWPVRLNQTIAEVTQRAVEAVGMPDWTEEEHAFSRALQKGAGVPETGLATQTTPLTGPAIRSRRPTIAAMSPGRCRWAASGSPPMYRTCRFIIGARAPLFLLDRP